MEFFALNLEIYSLMKLFFSFSILIGNLQSSSSSNQFSQPKKIPKLFVFGDSYVDTGNMEDYAECWISPSGITFPGKPSGRYSDGLVSTDFLAKVLGAEPPYNYKTHGKKKGLKRGMNFAYGESGVFVSRTPNLTAQVNLLVGLVLARHVYTPEDITPEDVSFISYAGREYFDFIEKPPTTGMKAFVEKIVDDLHVRMIRIGGLLFKKIAITSLQPIGCLPSYNSEFKSCNESINAMVDLHNKLLKQVVDKLNKDSKLKKNGEHYFVIDLHNAFMTILKNKGRKRFKTPLRACCEGNCGLVDDKGVKNYTLCDDPKSSFFWDDVRPSQEGWRSIYSVLGNPLKT